ncbi:TPA: hypothetical protein ACTUT5_000764 [Legionella anisa]|nr:hypothetical protein [Legionella anisa]MBN5934101.1 hypothetical protein [Legionella anisa]
MSQFASILLLVFFLKLLSVGLTTRLFLNRYSDLLGSILGAWSITECIYILLMLILSSFTMLTTFYMWIGLIFFNFILLIFCMRIKESPQLKLSNYKLLMSTNGLIAIVGAVTIFLILTYRSLYYYDNTWDAITYGLTRIEF